LWLRRNGRQLRLDKDRLLYYAANAKLWLSSNDLHRSEPGSQSAGTCPKRRSDSALAFDQCYDFSIDLSLLEWHDLAEYLLIGRRSPLLWKPLDEYLYSRLSFPMYGSDFCRCPARSRRSYAT